MAELKKPGERGARGGEGGKRGRRRGEVGKGEKAPAESLSVGGAPGFRPLLGPPTPTVGPPTHIRLVLAQLKSMNYPQALFVNHRSSC